MSELPPDILSRLIDVTAEPMLAVSTARPDWPVVLANAAFCRLHGGVELLDRPLADVVEQLLGRDLALEVSETVRSGQESSIPVILGKREHLLVLQPLSVDGSADGSSQFYAAHLRSGHGIAPGAPDSDMHHALRRARRRIRDLSRDDAVTGLLNEAAFREVLAHDWAVAAREKSSLALIAFTLNDFEAYLDVFGRHAGDSCLRRVAQALKRSLRRASDVAARFPNGGGETLVVLSHAADESGVLGFAERISAAVRELGIHHPRSKTARFVTVSHCTSVARADQSDFGDKDFLDRLVSATIS